MQPNDPLYAQQWHLGAIGNIELIWDEYSGAGIHVGVYDSGIEADHPDLAANYDPSMHVVIGGNPVDGEPNLTQPDDYHGTIVAGVLGAAANNDGGIVGVAWGSSITSVNILDPAGSIYIDAVDGLNFLSAVRQMRNFDIVNNSWGNDNFFIPLVGLHDPLSRVRAIEIEYSGATAFGRGGLGTVIVQGVGNDNREANGYGLSTSRYTISVAATRDDGFVWANSNYGASVLVSAPGVDILTTDITGAEGGIAGDYGTASGTSLATPIVSGIAALMLEANSNLGWRDVQNILAASATHTGSAFGAAAHANENSVWAFNAAANWNGGGMHFSTDYGFGQVDAYNSVRMAEVWSLFAGPQSSGNEHSWFNFENPNVAIPDDGEVTRTLNFATTPNSIRLEHVDVFLTITHTDYSALRIFLESPAGTEIQLFDGSGASGTTSDSSFPWIFGVDLLRGEYASGNWTVRIEDVGAAADTGTLEFFQVIAYGERADLDVNLRDDVFHYTDEFLAMTQVALQGGRTTLTDSGGVDWINAAAVTGDVSLNLGAGEDMGVDGVTWFTIGGGTIIEHAVSGDGDDTLLGNAASNKLYGMRGNDTLNGMGGGDVMAGFRGNDIYFVDNKLDIVRETGGDGTDLVQSSITFSLANTARVLGLVERLTLIGSSAINGVGNGLVNMLTGNNQANTLDGGAGNDTLKGMNGNDILIGGLGKDTMTGGANNDTFVFLSKTHSGKGGAADIILDFDDGGTGDRIDVNALFGPRMTYIHAAAFTKAGQVRINDVAGADVVVEVNTGGSLAADFSIRLKGTTLASMAANDFVLA
jgi:subtilisin-like proprotein convertase family protein